MKDTRNYNKDHSRFSTGGPVLGDDLEDGTWQSNRHGKYDYNQRQNEEKHKDEKSSPDPRHDVDDDTVG